MILRQHLIAALPWLLVASTAYAQYPADFVATAKAQLVRNFKDPASAQFRDLYVSRSGENFALCGEVNAKNSYGGYIGFSRFFSSGNGFAQVQSVGGDPVGGSGLTVNAETMSAMWPAVCTQKVADVP